MEYLWRKKIHSQKNLGVNCKSFFIFRWLLEKVDLLSYVKKETRRPWVSLIETLKCPRLLMFCKASSQSSPCNCCPTTWLSSEAAMLTVQGTWPNLLLSNNIHSYFPNFYFIFFLYFFTVFFYQLILTYVVIYNLHNEWNTLFHLFLKLFWAKLDGPNTYSNIVEKSEKF